MERISAASFVATRREADVRSNLASLIPRAARTSGVLAECGEDGVALLLALARIDAVLEGFPVRVPLGETGRLAGVEAVLADRGWKFAGSEEVMVGLADNVGPVGPGMARGCALRVLGLPCSKANRSALAGISGWEGDLGTVLDACFARLHDHTVRSVAAYSGSLLDHLGLRRENVPAVVAAAWRRCDLFPRDLPEAEHGVEDTLSRAARHGGAEVVAALLDRRLATRGARMPHPGTEISAALHAAVTGRGHDSLDIVRLLAAAGGRVGPGRRGRTALHVLADADVPVPHERLAMARLLIALGADQACRDIDGRTAAEVYAASTSLQAPGDALLRALRSPEPEPAAIRGPR